MKKLYMTMMKNMLKGNKKAIIAMLCGLAFIVGVICTEKVKATLKVNYNISSKLDVLPAHKILPVADSLASTLPFINDSLCFIKDPENSMSAFFNELVDLLNGKDTVINIVHLGDSHIQAGFLSGRTMRLMQNSFGNAGRGWIAPFKLSKLNEPNDYYISSNIKEWIAGRCVQLRPKCPWGIGGIGIQTDAKDIGFDLIMTPTNGAGYSFNKVVLYRDLHSTPMIPRYENRDSVSEISWGTQPYENNIAIDTFVTKNLIDTFSIKSANVNMDGEAIKKSKSNRYYGFMLMNSNPGILYHSIGVNGAKFTDYTSREYIRQLSLLKPSLLIISLGTNESFGKYFKKDAFEDQIDALISLIREEIPEATLLITTPAETYKRVYRNKKYQYVRNENIAKVADVISSYTKDNGIASWDFYSVSGGDNSCQKWYNAKLLGRDRIHFSRDGYEEQGTLLYKAIIRSCTSGQYTFDTMASAGETTKTEINTIEAADMDEETGKEGQDVE